MQLKSIKKLVEKFLFGSKWLLVPFYFGLIIAQLVYLYWFTGDVWHMITHAKTMSNEEGMLVILELVDVVMVASLIKMIISGSYTSFISKDHSETSEKSSSGLLKVKMASSLVGVSSIHLLQSFINSEKLDWDTINKQIWIHIMFLIGAIILMVIEYIHIKSEKIEHDMHNDKPKIKTYSQRNSKQQGPQSGGQTSINTKH